MQRWSNVPFISADTHSILNVWWFWSDHWGKHANLPRHFSDLLSYFKKIKKSFELSPIRGWTAVYGQRPVCLCGRTPANLAVESGWLPDFSGFLTASPVRLSTLPSCWTHCSARFTRLPVSVHFNSKCQSIFSACWIHWAAWLKRCH